MTKENIEKFAGENVRLTMIDNVVFQGILWFIRYEDENEINVKSIIIDTQSFEFCIEHVKSIEIVS